MLPGRCSLPPRPHRPPSPSPPGARRSLAGIRRGLTPRNTKKRRHRRAAPVAEANEKEIRLSATDISALASMKNVAKCDTWCELQNPVNHRVFERKLRPRDPPEGTPASWALEAHPRSGDSPTRTLALRAVRRGGPKCAAAVCGRERRVVGYCARRPEPHAGTGPCLTP